MMLQRNLLYTAVTRARRLVVLVGQPKAIAMAVRNNAGLHDTPVCANVFSPPADLASGEQAPEFVQTGRHAGDVLYDDVDPS